MMRLEGSNEPLVIRGDRVGIAFKGAEWMRIRELLTQIGEGDIAKKIPEFVSAHLGVGLFFSREEWAAIANTVRQLGEVTDVELAEKLVTLVRTAG